MEIYTKYELSGVSITNGEDAVKSLKSLIQNTYNTNVTSNYGSFGGEFKYNNLTLVSSIDGVGTKSIFCEDRKGLEAYINLGKDIVNHSINDILVQGAFPLFFMDYFGCDSLNKEILVKEEEDFLQSYARRKEILEQYGQEKLHSKKLLMEAEQKLAQEAKEHAISTAVDGLNELSQINKTAFNAAKAVNISKAIMNTYQAATNALASIPFPWNLVAAAGVAATGFAQVQQIRSQQYAGRALGGQVRGGESYLVGERGPELLTMGSNGKVTPNDKMQPAQSSGQSQSVNISFQITANDARGFDQLLQERRGMIMGMINQAMNNQGKRALV